MTLGLLKQAAMCIPSVRRMLDFRDQLIVERNHMAAEIAARDATIAALEQHDPQAGAMRVARAENRLFMTDYPYFPKYRPIEEGAGGKRLTARLRAGEGDFTAVLSDIAQHVPMLARIPRQEADSRRPYWENPWFPPFDGTALYGLIAGRKPSRYIEVGSGISTRFARQAIVDTGAATRIVSIDPQPRSDVEALCDEVVRYPMENVPRDFWEGLGPDDMLFVDNSHRSFPDSDVTAFFMDVLPALKPGTIWGIHDIFLPWDYPVSWADRYYNEQYLLQSYLLGGADGDEIVLPVHWAVREPALRGVLAPLWDRKDLFDGLMIGGGAFWMRRGPG